MASAERSVGVRNDGAARWLSSLASLDFTVHLFSAAAIRAGILWSNVPGPAAVPGQESRFRGDDSHKVYYGISRYTAVLQVFLRRNRQESQPDSGPGLAPEGHASEGSDVPKIGAGFGADPGFPGARKDQGLEPRALSRSWRR